MAPVLGERGGPYRLFIFNGTAYLGSGTAFTGYVAAAFACVVRCCAVDIVDGCCIHSFRRCAICDLVGCCSHFAGGDFIIVGVEFSGGDFIIVGAVFFDGGPFGSTGNGGLDEYDASLNRGVPVDCDASLDRFLVLVSLVTISSLDSEVDSSSGGSASILELSARLGLPLVEEDTEGCSSVRLAAVAAVLALRLPLSPLFPRWSRGSARTAPIVRFPFPRWNRESAISLLRQTIHHLTGV